MCCQDVADKCGFSVVKEFMGHGLGRHLHMAPLVHHYRHAAVRDVMVREARVSVSIVSVS